MARGGARPGAGRKSRAEELQLIEKLTPLEDEALKQLEKGIKANDFAFIKLYFEYFYGKPSDNINLGGEVTQKTIINFVRKAN